LNQALEELRFVDRRHLLPPRRAGVARGELVQVSLDLFPEAGRLAAVAGEALGGLFHLA
jgi:hypothetical protein